MSATNRGTKRRLHDNYPTPAWCVHRLFDKLTMSSGSWVEPCAGDGSIIRATNKVVDGIKWYAYEIRDECSDDLNKIATSVDICDFLTIDHFDGKLAFDVAITNPPFRFAIHFIKQCLRIADEVIMFQRLSFLGSARRCRFFTKCMPDIYVLPDRPSFTNDGHTDAEAYAWFHWDLHNNQAGHVRMLDTTSVYERRKYYGSK